VNAFSAGIVEVGKQISATSSGVGNPVFIVGSATGKDGIHGASFASKDLDEDSAEDIPSVQVGDPFQEKLLLEATMELATTDAVVGMQDMGAAGITCSSCEMSAAGEHGMDVWLDKVPLRQNMEPWEILLSESQERMLIVVEKGKEQKVLDIFDKWDLECEEIGVVTEGGTVNYFWDSELVGALPAESAVLGGGAPVYHREWSEPTYYQEFKNFDINAVEEPADLKSVATKMVALPNIASKRFIYEQYDSMVGTRNMGTNDPSDAGVVNIKGTDKALAMSVDCNSRFVNADPEVGCAMAVSEAARNITCSGGIPSAVTNCLNFGNPYNPEVYWQFVGSIKVMSAACEKFETPVTGGNVSFYNQTQIGDTIEPVFPTPTIGMIGVVEDKKFITTLSYKAKGDLIFMIGVNRDDISSSQYLINIHGVSNSSTPYFDLEEEYANQKQVQMLIREGVLNSAHDLSEGGLWVGLLEKGFASGLGFDITLPAEHRKDAVLFGESASRILVTVSEENKDKFIDLMMLNGCDFDLLGHVTKGGVRVDDEDWGHVSEYQEIYDSALGTILSA
jgi:phosphoribosylformylglycinamidine synthase